MNYIEILKALADQNRLTIMCYLQTGKKCVCEIEELLAISQSSASKHLNKLKMANLIASEKTGQWVHYSIPPTLYTDFPFIEKLLRDASSKYLPNTIHRKNHEC